MKDETKKTLADSDISFEVELSDEALDAEIDKLLTHPTIDAMLENVAQDASDDIVEAVEGVLSAGDTQTPAPPVEVTRAEFEELKARVANAFKHAGFKF